MKIKTDAPLLTYVTMKLAALLNKLQIPYQTRLCLCISPITFPAGLHKSRVLGCGSVASNTWGSSVYNFIHFTILAARI